MQHTPVRRAMRERVPERLSPGPSQAHLGHQCCHSGQEPLCLPVPLVEGGSRGASNTDSKRQKSAFPQCHHGGDGDILPSMVADLAEGGSLNEGGEPSACPLYQHTRVRKFYMRGLSPPKCAVLEPQALGHQEVTNTMLCSREKPPSHCLRSQSHRP